jgi:UDP-glucuronate 4-epimerase
MSEMGRQGKGNCFAWPAASLCFAPVRRSKGEKAVILVTGAAGFIGFSVTRRLLDRGAAVIGLDSLSPYYDPRLKRARLAQLEGRNGFVFHQVDLADRAAASAVLERHPEIEGIIHLAAQAGVRHSLTQPFDYI